MSKKLQRRRFLTYMGLGTLGIGIASCTSQLSSVSSSQPITSNTLSDNVPNNAPKSDVNKSTNNSEVSTVAVNDTSGSKLQEFQGISQWLNSNPLSIQDLKGNIVLIQFWTFSCINCQRTLPYVTGWYDRYADKGLKIIGVHSPEFAFERDVNNIKDAIQKHGIRYPVPIDNEFKTWNAYGNQYWPHLYLADRQGNIVYDHIGEGAYDLTERTIKQLLG